MTRRASYMYGNLLPKDEKGQVDAGLGKTHVRRARSPSSSRPHIVARTGETLTVDGVEIEFQLTPGTEAPSELNFYFPQLRALCMAENCTHTLHNLYTLRGAQVRDAHAWSTYMNETIELYADKTDVIFASHHWPCWGTERCRELLAEPARHVPVPARPDAAPGQPGLHQARDRRDDDAAAASSTAPGTTAATTAASATTSRPSTSGTWAGSTATRPTCTRCRRWSPARGTWSSSAAPTRCSPRRGRPTSAASTAGWRSW